MTVSETDSSANTRQALLAEFGHFYLMLESHQMASQHCREQLERLRQELMKLETPPAS